MSDCTRCGAKANNAFLCRKCLLTAQTTLADLPWWLNRLTEAAVGQTRMTDNVGRKSARRKDLDGDAELAACIELLPKADDLEKARTARQKQSLAHAVATGGVNLRASELLAEIADSLYNKAKNGDTAALIWWTKAQMRWAETQRHENSGPDGGPQEHTFRWIE
jgi:hypothetical protein